MGAWGIGHFDNDTACDWAYELEGSTDLSAIESAINAAHDEDYLDADVASEVLAAAEVLARLKGQSGIQNSYTETVDQWIASNPLKPSPELIAKAKTAIHRVLGENSELAELWEESDESAAWRDEVSSLLSRLGD